LPDALPIFPPASAALGLLGGLLHVADDPCGEALERLLAVGRPGADQRLVEQVLVVAVRGAVAVDLLLEASRVRAPPPHLGGPGGRHLRQYVDAGADVLAALGVVGGGGQHRLGPTLEPPGVPGGGGGGRVAVGGGGWGPPRAGA